MMQVLIVVLAVLGVCFAGPAADKITTLPGWNGVLPSSQYSGFLSVEGGSNLHYWFVEAENDPKNVPIVLWLNGGPGCSSLDGFIYEMGPFEVQEDLSLVTRDSRWNKDVNMLYIEAPVGVGFSYNDNADYACNDDRTAEENMLAMARFFELFPEHKKNSFYLFGESYAGVYVPTLAESIVTKTLEGTWTGAKLAGIAVGNGCSGTDVGICGRGTQGTYYEWQYLLQTAFISNALKTKVNAACDWQAASKNEKNALSAKCTKLLNDASEQINNINVYNIYGDCVPGASGCKPQDETYASAAVGVDGTAHPGKVPIREALTLTDRETGKEHTLNGRIMSHGPNACIDSRLASAYLNQPAVMSALHVDIAKNGQSCWSVCGSAPGWSYNSTRTNLPEHTYPLLVSNIRVTIYNGDWDACVPFTDGEGWTSSMNLPIKNDWHSWAYTSDSGADNQVGGYATEYDVSHLGDGSFEFITVRGGRHEVPETAPDKAAEMLKRVVNNQGF